MRFQRSCLLSALLQEAVESLRCEKGLVHVSLMERSGYGKPIYAGFGDRALVYPASLSKLYIAAAILHDARHGRVSLEQHVVVAAHNVRPLDSEMAAHPYAPPQANQSYTIGFLLYRMLTVSDDTSANVLIDLIRRPRINRFVQHYGWRGSEVTRKFLPRKLEDLGYKRAPVTVTTTRHLAEFLYRLVSGRLLDGEGSQYLLDLLYQQADQSKIARGLSPQAVYAHKTGWFTDPSQNKKKLHSTGDCGIIHFNGYHHCIVAAIVQLPEEEGKDALSELGRRLECVVKRFRERVSSV